MSRVVIVARTRMHGDDRCVGGHDLDHGFRGVRLLDRFGGHPRRDSPFQVGQVWDVQYVPKGSARPPHVEDVYVDGQEYVGDVPDIRTLILQRCAPWEGPPEALFDGTVRVADSGALYIPARGRLPQRSTGYWRPMHDLEPQTLPNGRPRFLSCRPGPEVRLAWVGETQRPERIDAGSLLRVSLSRLFDKPPAAHGYYVQISGIL